MVFLAAGPDITPIQDLILTWTHIGQACRLDWRACIHLRLSVHVKNPAVQARKRWRTGWRLSQALGTPLVRRVASLEK
jgi:hypothetical protein